MDKRHILVMVVVEDRQEPLNQSDQLQFRFWSLVAYPESQKPDHADCRTVANQGKFTVLSVQQTLARCRRSREYSGLRDGLDNSFNIVLQSSN